MKPVTKKDMTDSERLDWMEEQFGCGLISDDNGHWAFSDWGFQNVVTGGPKFVQTSLAMSDTRWAKVEACHACGAYAQVDPGEWFCLKLGRSVEERPLAGIHPDCPLPSPGDMPEVRALVEAARLALTELDHASCRDNPEHTRCFKCAAANEINKSLAPFDKTK